MTDKEIDNYKVFLEHRQALISAEFQIGIGLDKAILTLSAGALAVSMTFIADIVKQPVTIWALIGAWILFGSAIGTNLLSIYFCQLAYSKARDNLDYEQNKKSQDKDINKQTKENLHVRRNCWNTLAKTGTLLAVVWFLIGLIFLGIFVWINLTLV